MVRYSNTVILFGYDLSQYSASFSIITKLTQLELLVSVDMDLHENKSAIGIFLTSQAWFCLTPLTIFRCVSQDRDELCKIWLILTNCNELDDVEPKINEYSQVIGSRGWEWRPKKQEFLHFIFVLTYAAVYCRGPSKQAC